MDDNDGNEGRNFLERFATTALAAALIGVPATAGAQGRAFESALEEALRNVDMTKDSIVTGINANIGHTTTYGPPAEMDRETMNSIGQNSIRDTPTTPKAGGDDDRETNTNSRFIPPVGER